jgi:hypothetical protein
MTDGNAPVARGYPDTGYTEAEGYAASLRQQARWVRECKLDGTIDADELDAAAMFIDRISAVAKGWQDVETAPHETRVLLGWIYDGAWFSETGMASHGWSRNGVSNMSRHGQATHWRPLPDGPVVSSTSRTTPNDVTIATLKEAENGHPARCAPIPPASRCACAALGKPNIPHARNCPARMEAIEECASIAAGHNGVSPRDARDIATKIRGLREVLSLPSSADYCTPDGPANCEAWTVDKRCSGCPVTSTLSNTPEGK